MVQIPLLSGLLGKRNAVQMSAIQKAGIQFEKTIRLGVRQEYIGIMNETLRDAELEVGYRVDYGDSCFDVIAAPFLEAMSSVFGEIIIREWGAIYEGWIWYYSKKRTYPRKIVKALVTEPRLVNGEVAMKETPRMLDVSTFETLLERKLAKKIGETQTRGMGSAGVRPAKTMEEIDEELRYFGETEIIPDLKYACRVAWADKHIGIEEPIIIQNTQQTMGYNNSVVPTSSLRGNANMTKPDSNPVRDAQGQGT